MAKTSEDTKAADEKASKDAASSQATLNEKPGLLQKKPVPVLSEQTKREMDAGRKSVEEATKFQKEHEDKWGKQGQENREREGKEIESRSAEDKNKNK